MARRKRSRNEDFRVISNKGGLQDPFPSHPHRPTKYAVYVRYPADAPAGEARIIVITFTAAYATKKFVNLLLQDSPFKWKPADKKLFYDIPDTIVGENNVQIRIPLSGMEEIIEYELSPQEEEWEVPEWLARQALLIRRAPDEEMNEEGELVERVKPEKKVRVERPKIDKSGLISIGEIADQMGIDAKDARQSLRKQKIEKPAGGWLFSPDKVEDIKATVKKGLK